MYLLAVLCTHMHHSPVYKYLEYFLLFIIMNNASMSILFVSWYMAIRISLEYTARNGNVKLKKPMSAQIQLH